MLLIDIHSHHYSLLPFQKQVLTVDAAFLAKDGLSMPFLSKKALLSVGIHPWDVSEVSLDLVSELNRIFEDPRVVMMGEIGLDKVSSASFELQAKVLEAQISIAERIRKPILLHVVHAMTEILEIKNRHPLVPTWIIHGFRGSREAAIQYLNKGFYLSFGFKFNPESLLACPMNRLFVETDERENSLQVIYEQIAQVLQCSVETLAEQIGQNFCDVFGNDVL
jgi:Mg-dependent DNase